MNEHIKLNSFQVILKFRNKYNNCFNLSNTPVMHFTVTLATTLKKRKRKKEVESLSLNLQNYKFLHQNSRQLNNNPTAEFGHNLLLQTEFHAHVRNENERKREKEEEKRQKIKKLVTLYIMS